jgi:ATP-dependent RNA helicase DDX46/PRP5
LLRRILHNHVEIFVGRPSEVNRDILQTIELRPSSGKERFFRLLQLLGEWFERSKILIFVKDKKRCDDLFREVLNHGYPCLCIHGSKDQRDRKSAIADFKNNVTSILIATSIAARGLDVKDLNLVINYDVPDHYEDYVQRVGRTGRLGKKGTAITFLDPLIDGERSSDLVQALRRAGQPDPDELLRFATDWIAKRKKGLATTHNSGYKGSGFKFNIAEENLEKQKKIEQAYGIENFETANFLRKNKKIFNFYIEEKQKKKF